MSLPKIEEIVFTLVLPISKISLQYRPFKVKEEKILLIAEQSGDKEQMAVAIRQIIRNCVLSDIDIDNIPMFEVEYLFVAISAKSVGNIREFKIRDFEDDKIYDIEVDLDKVSLEISPEHSNTIDLDSNVKMTMKYPTLASLESMLSFDENDPTSTAKQIVSSIDKIYDDETVYDFTEETEETLISFVEGFSSNAMAQIKRFYETMPRIRYVVNYTNSLGNNRPYVMEGLRDFFP